MPVKYVYKRTRCKNNCGTLTWKWTKSNVVHRLTVSQQEAELATGGPESPGEEISKRPSKVTDQTLLRKALQPLKATPKLLIGCPEFSGSSAVRRRKMARETIPCTSAFSVGTYNNDKEEILSRANANPAKKKKSCISNVTDKTNYYASFK